MVQRAEAEGRAAADLELLPVIEQIALTGQDLGDFVWFAIIAVGVLVVGTVVVVGMVRSEKFTQWLAERTEAIANWGLGKIKREPLVALAEKLGGSLEYERSLGATMFTLSLPTSSVVEVQRQDTPAGTSAVDDEDEQVGEPAQYFQAD